MTEPAAQPPAKLIPKSPSLCARLARRSYLVEVQQKGARAARRVAPSVHQLAESVTRIDPSVGDRLSAAEQIGAVLALPAAEETSPRLVAALSLALDVPPRYLLDPGFADRDDSTRITRTLVGVGATGIRICRNVGQPSVPDVLMQVLEAVVEAKPVASTGRSS